MILNVTLNHNWWYAETLAERVRLMTEVMEKLDSDKYSEGLYDPGDDAWMMFSDKRHRNDTEMPNNYLRVSINRSTGYGGLIWFVSDDYPVKGGVFDHVWISDNPNPPDFDPRVVSDPGCPAFHDPRSAIPVSQVYSAVEEFCRVGTGLRPECIQWVRGHVNGQRLDGEPIMEFVELQESPWWEG